MVGSDQLSLIRFFPWFIIRFIAIYDNQRKLNHKILSGTTLITLERSFSEPLSAREPRVARGFLAH